MLGNVKLSNKVLTITFINCGVYEISIYCLLSPQHRQ